MLERLFQDWKKPKKPKETPAPAVAKSRQASVSTLWAAGDLCAFDTETTGPDPETARIVTATVGSEEIQTWLVNPGVEIPPEATAIHGVTNERVASEGLAASDALPQIAEALRRAWSAGVAVVAFNGVFDFTVLDRDLRRHGHDGLSVGIVIDPFVLDREVDRYRKGKRNLSALCEHYGIAQDGAHDSAADARAAVALARAIAKDYPQIAAMQPSELRSVQVLWHAEREADFAKYLKRIGKPSDDVYTDWPLRSWPPAPSKETTPEPSDVHGDYQAAGWDPTMAGQRITGTILEIVGGSSSNAPSSIVLETADGPVPVVMGRTVLRSEWERSDPQPRIGDAISIEYQGVVESRDGSHTYHKYDLRMEYEEDPDKAEAFLRDALANGPRELSSLHSEARDKRLASRALTAARKSIGAEIMHFVPGMEGGTFWGLPGTWPPGTQKKEPAEPSS